MAGGAPRAVLALDLTLREAPPAPGGLEVRVGNSTERHAAENPLCQYVRAARPPRRRSRRKEGTTRTGRPPRRWSRLSRCEGGPVAGSVVSVSASAPTMSVCHVKVLAEPGKSPLGGEHCVAQGGDGADGGAGEAFAIGGRCVYLDLEVRKQREREVSE